MQDAENGVVDITDLVERLRQSFVSWGTKFVIISAASVPWLAFLSLPVIRELFEFILTQIIDALSKGLEMEAFFFNTAIRKASQARDFIEAVEAKNALPPTASKEEYESAEKRQMAAFRNFVIVTQ